VDFVELLESTVGIKTVLVGLGGVLAYIWKNRVHLRDKYHYEKLIDVERNEHEIRISQLRSELDQSSKYYEQMRTSFIDKEKMLFAKIVEKIGEVIDENYKLLVKLYNSCKSILEPDLFARSKPEMSVAYENALPCFDKYLEHFENNKIYFTKDASDKLSKFLLSVDNSLGKARGAINSGQKLGIGPQDALHSLFRAVTGELSDAKYVIEEEFRLFVGSNIPVSNIAFKFAPTAPDVATQRRLI